MIGKTFWPLAWAAVLASIGAAHAQHQFWTAPTGPGGTWNLYEVVTPVATWTNADNAAKAKAASATNLASMAGITTTGHLVQIGSSYENDFVCAASVLTPGSGNSNVWLGLNDVATEMFNSPTGWEWSGTAGPEVLDDGEFYAWAPGEPNNSGEEDVAEMRTDGMWNDNKDNAATTRKYVIEWEINSAIPIADARQYQVYYTAPFGPGGTWNLYKAVFQGTTFAGAHSIATTTPADSTGVAGVAGNPATGHLVSIGGQMENDFVFQIMAYSSMGSVNTWLGTDDPTYGGTESGFSKTTGWVWAGTSDPWTYEKFSSRPRIAAAINTPTSSGEPNNGNGAGEHYAEMTSNSFWNDAVASSATGTTYKRYVIEWDIGSATPIAGAATRTLPIMDTAALPAAGGVPAVGDWRIRRVGGTGVTSGNVPWMSQMTRYQPAAATISNIVSPVLNHNDINTNNFAGRGAGGLFFQDLPIPGDTASTDDNTFLTVANTKLDLSGPGPWTLNIHADDGIAVRIIGATVIQVGGSGVADFSYGDGAYNTIGGGDCNVRVTFTVPAAGQYDVHFTHWEGTGGAYYEMSMAPGAWLNDWDTQWTLVGGPYTGTPALPNSAALGMTPPTTPGWWNVVTRPVVFAANNPTTYNSHLEKLIADFVAAVAGAAAPLGSGEVPVMNLADLNNPNREMLSNDIDFPATGADDNNFATAALGTFRFNAGVHTFNIRCDDLCAIRFGNGAQILGRVSILANGSIDPFDPSTFIWWQAAGDINCKMVVRFPTTGDYEFQLFHAEGTGGSAAEVSWLPGVQTEDFSGSWIPLGDSTSLVPVLPTSLPGIPTDPGMWSIHEVRGAGQITSIQQAAEFLNDPAVGIHTDSQSPVINHVDDGGPGVGGYFAGDRNLPGETPGTNEDDFAIAAKAILHTPTAGLYTIVLKTGDAAAIRLPGNRFLAVTKVNTANSLTWDPADPSTISVSWNGTATTDDAITRGLVYLPAGYQPIELVSYDRAGGWNVEVYARPGNVTGTAEYVLSGTANLGNAIIQGDWRLVGHTAEPNLAIPGMVGQWSVRQSPHAAAAPAAPWDTINAYTWLTGQTITPVSVDWINYNDPGFGGPGSILNDLPIPVNTAGTASDDNNYATEMRGTLRIPADGTYYLGWQGDDGGFIEFEGAAPPLFTRIVAAGVANGIVTSTDGVLGARIEVNGGGGNTRTIGAVTLLAGDYPIRCFWREGTGGSYFEIFASPAGGEATMVSLLKANGSSIGTDVAGIQIQGTKIKLVNAALTPTNAFTFAWESIPGFTYQVQRSTNLTNWTPVLPTITAVDTTTSWTSPAPIAPADPRYFYRAVIP